jgi:hypothetical protein
MATVSTPDWRAESSMSSPVVLPEKKWTVTRTEPSARADARVASSSRVAGLGRGDGVPGDAPEGERDHRQLPCRVACASCHAAAP